MRWYYILVGLALGCASQNTASQAVGGTANASGATSGARAGSGGSMTSGGHTGGAASGGTSGATGGSSGAAGAIIDSTSISKKFLFGYQGWFLCPNDGSAPNRWVHWFKTQTPSATNLSVDMWPDTSELDADELFATEMRYANGQPARLYSAFNQKTVVRHFLWMKENGIDGVMLQRFASELSDNAFFTFRNQVAENVRAGAEAHGRVFAIMYDISGMNPATLVDELKQDWAYLVGTLEITSSQRYLRHNGKPLLAIWGLGFNDRPGTAVQAAEINAWFRSGAPAAERVTLLGGVPTDWRTLGNDSRTDAAWADIYRSFDVISPWSVGRYADAAGADDFRRNKIAPDLAAAQAAGVEYMPVVFPGFSWKNLHDGPLNQIPRNGGTFFWHQVHNAIDAGSTMLYGAMFDELDEATAMFKIAATAGDAPAQGDFVTLDADNQALPSDWYLRLAGEASKMLRGDIPLSASIPITP